MGMRRRIEAKVTQTLAHAQGTLSRADRAVLELKESLLELFDEVEDGVTIELRRTGSIMDFIRGTTDVMPIVVRVIPRETEGQQNAAGNG